MSDPKGPVTYMFNVGMSCGGCSRAVNNVLKKFKDANPDNVISYNVDLDKKTAEVVVAPDTLSEDEVKQAIEKSGKTVEKTGRTVTSVKEDGKSQSVEVKDE